MNLNPGDLYFIRERDVLNNTTSAYCKIGLVRDQRTGDSGDRVLEHQTGNPRQLELVDEVNAPAVSRLEASMHSRLATIRILGEWFDLPTDADLAAAVELARRLATQQAEHLDALTLAAELKSVASTDAVITPDDDHLHWYRLAVAAKDLSGRTKDLAKRSQAVFRNALDAGRCPGRFATITHRTKPRLDQDLLAASHPDVIVQFTRTEPWVTPRFTLKKPTSELADPIPEAFTDFAARFEPLIAEATGNHDALEDLHLAHLELLGFADSAKWEQELAEANLKAACGDAAGIDGLASWSRTPGEKTTFDTTAFKKALPDLHAQFTSPETIRAFKVQPMRSYRARDAG